MLRTAMVMVMETMRAMMTVKCDDDARTIEMVIVIEMEMVTLRMIRRMLMMTMMIMTVTMIANDDGNGVRMIGKIQVILMIVLLRRRLVFMIGNDGHDAHMIAVVMARVLFVMMMLVMMMAMMLVIWPHDRRNEDDVACGNDTGKRHGNDQHTMIIMMAMHDGNVDGNADHT